jgi:hypothetical protein
MSGPLHDGPKPSQAVKRNYLREYKVAGPAALPGNFPVSAGSADVSFATGILPDFGYIFHFPDNHLAGRSGMVFRRMLGSGHSGRDALAAGDGRAPGAALPKGSAVIFRSISFQ